MWHLFMLFMPFFQLEEAQRVSLHERIIAQLRTVVFSKAKCASDGEGMGGAWSVEWLVMVGYQVVDEHVWQML
jgi:hypothetical protein